MKRIVLLAMAMFLIALLPSCSRQRAVTGMGYAEGQDQQYFYSDMGSNTLLTESEDGYYYFTGFYLCYTDKETMQSSVLCGRPECLHQNETNPERILDCNAYFFNPLFLQYYDGDLYVAADKPLSTQEKELTQVSLDGAKRKSTQTFSDGASAFAIHRGTLYYTGQIVSDGGESCHALLSKPLFSSNEPEILYIGTIDSNIGALLCKGELLYFSDNYFTEERFYGLDYQYNLQTGERTLLFDSDQQVQTIYTLYSQGLLGQTSQLDEENVWQITEQFQTDLYGKNRREVLVPDPHPGTRLYGDTQYLYQYDVFWHQNARPTEEQKLSVISADEKEIFSIPTGTLGVRNFFPGNDRHCFLYAEQSQSEEKLLQWYLCEKADFADGEGSPILLMEMNAEQAMQGFAYTAE